MIAQVTRKLFDLKYVQLFNKTVRHLKDTADLGLHMQPLDKNSLHLRVFSDSYFANNPDLSLQLGYIVLLWDKHGNCNLLHYTSHKSRRSVLGSEVYAFDDAFEYASTMKHNLEAILGKHIPLKMLTDSKSLFDVITKNSSTFDRRLMIDVKVVGDAYDDFFISDVGFVRTHNTLPTPSRRTCDPLSYIVTTGKPNFDVELCVLRRKDSPTSDHSSTSHR